MAPERKESVKFKYESQVYLAPKVSGLSKEEVRRFYFRTHSSAEFQAPQSPEEAGSENFYDIHMVGQRDSKYMKYQWKKAPLWDRSLCTHAREFQPHDLSDIAVTGQLAEVIKSKQGVGRAKTQAPFAGRTKYTDDYKIYSKAEARGALRPSQKPVVQVDSKGRPYHPLIGTDKMEETCSHEHQQFGCHPLELAKAERAVPPKANLGLSPSMVPSSTAYREEYFTENGVPRKPLRKPVRCKSAPLMRGPVEALPNWMRQSASVVTGKSWAESRVIPQAPPAVRQPRQRPASAGALGSRCEAGSHLEAERGVEGRSSAGPQVSSSALARTNHLGSAGGSNTGAPGRARRPASASAIRSGVVRS
jgi:hypothetical protein